MSENSERHLSSCALVYLVHLLTLIFFQTHDLLSSVEHKKREILKTMKLQRTKAFKLQKGHKGKTKVFKK